MLAKKIIDLTCELIKIPTVTTSQKANYAAFEYIKHFFGESNLELKEYVNNGIKTILITSKDVSEIDVLFNGHIDVVAGSDDQFIPYVEGDKLYGRGSWDMKGALAVLLLLAKDSFRDTQHGLLITSDEEIGGKNGSGYLIESKQITCKYFLTGEPTDLKVVKEGKGVMWFKLKIKGKSTHASTPWLGVNPIYKINELLQLIYKRYPIPNKEEWKTTIIPSKIDFSNSQNQIPEEIWIKCDCRYIPEDDPKAICAYMEEIADDLEIELVEPSFLKIEHKYTTILEKMINKKPGKVHFASDARFFSSVGIPSIILGPMGKNIHGKKEWVSIKSLEEYYLVLNKFIKNKRY